MTSSPRPEPATLFVCHAGATLGIGHLTRMLAVAVAVGDAAALGNAGAVGTAGSRFVIQGEPVERQDLAGFEHEFIDFDTDLMDAVTERCVQYGPDVVVFDLHPKLIPEDFSARAAALHEQGIRLVGIDSLLPLCDLLDITWVPSLLVDDAGCEAVVHSGWDSFLIARRLPVAQWSPGSRVLVLTGGSDVTQQAATLPAMLDASLPDESQVGWVKGPFAEDPVLPAEPRLDWAIHDAPAGLDELIARSDYALTLFGVTLFELLQYGTPTVVFSPYADRKFPELDLVAAAGAAVVADGATDAVNELVALMANDGQARLLSNAALQQMAVNGADRLAGLIHSLTE